MIRDSDDLVDDAPPAVRSAAPIHALASLRDGTAAGGRVLTARLIVDGDDPNLRGHFPGLAIFPGVFVIEAVCQAMAKVAEREDKPLLLHEVNSVRFLAPLLDGDELTLRLQVNSRGDGRWQVRALGTRQDGASVVRIAADFIEREVDHV